MHTIETFQNESEDGKTVHNTFNVYGGSVIFAATAPHVTQHIYGNHISTLPTVTPEEAEEVSKLTKEELKLFRYIPQRRLPARVHRSDRAVRLSPRRRPAGLASAGQRLHHPGEHRDGRVHREPASLHQAD